MRVVMFCVALAGLVLSILALTGCDGPPSKAARSQVVRSCPDGSLIGFDPVTKRYWFLRDTGWTRNEGDLAPGIKPKDFC